MDTLNEIDGEAGDINIVTTDSGGNGRPVLLIHGWPLSGKSWSEQIPVLKSAGYRVITYDRRGFGESDKPENGYDYDTLSDDLANVIDALGLSDVTLVGFSMGGGEVARYISRYGEEKIHSVVFAAAVPPMLLKTDDNPDGPLDKSAASEMEAEAKHDLNGFYETFLNQFFSANANGQILVSDAQRNDALELCKLAYPPAVYAAMEAFSSTDFRNDLTQITVPSLVIHGDADGVVPIEGSGKRTNQIIPNSELHVVKGGPHGINVSHADEFNNTLLDFLNQ